MIKKLTEAEILNCNIPWTKILDIDNIRNFSVVKTENLEEFSYNENPNEIKAGCKIDMCTLLSILKNRQCSIKIPQYTKTTNSKVKTNQVKVDFDTRGKIIDLKSNQNTFNFSVTILDESKVEVNDVKKDFDSCPTTFTITDENGVLSNNWKNLVFDVTDKESDFLKNVIDVNGNIVCDTFVNNQLAQAFYTQYYKCCKLIVDRLVAERKYISDTKKRFVSKLSDYSTNYVTEATEDKKPDVQNTCDENEDNFVSKTVKCFEAKISTVNKDTFNFTYIDTEKLTPREIVTMCNNYMRGLINITSDFKFYCRCVELAFVKMNPYKEDLKPTELQTYNRLDCKWNEQKVKLPRCRIEWFELMFKDYSILCRYYDKTIKQKIEGNNE